MSTATVGAHTRQPVNRWAPARQGFAAWRHKAALKGFGPTSIHRRTWVFMDHLPWSLPRPNPQLSLFEESA